MALGEPIGFCMRMSQNNGEGGLYPPWEQGTREVHISLHGDPTLRLHPVKPASNLNASSSPGRANLTWEPSTDSDILGYHVYRAASPEGPFARVTEQLLSSPSFSETPSPAEYTYMVRAIKLEQTPSGTYLNPSPGIFASTTVTGTPVNNDPLQLTVRRTSSTEIMVTVNGQSGQRYRLEWSNNFQSWTQFSEGTLVETNSDVPLTVENNPGVTFIRSVNAP
jgi:hypothetical protein